MEGAGTLETEGTGTLELILTDVKGLSIITERRSSLLSSLQAWKLSVKMQISVGMKLTAHRKKNCLWVKEIQIKRQKKDG